MALIEIPYFGSFQNEGAYYQSENPQEEVWAHISRLGTSSFQERHFKPDNKNVPWDEYLKYIRIRIQQAIEFRKASRSSTILTSPLTLYYSFLNLTRAFLVLGPEIMPKASHGLRFIQGADIFSSKAALVEGTFTDYLNSANVKWQKNDEITLRDALGFIVELAHDYVMYDKESSHVQGVYVKAINQGPVRLSFIRASKGFELSWEKEFPHLAASCSYDSENCLLVNEPEVEKGYEYVAKYLSENLMPCLNLLETPTWYIYRKNNEVITLSRVGYYYVAMFILGSAVRYQPELIFSLGSSDSEEGWILKRFLTHAERFVPQLKLCEFYRSEMYF